MKTIILVSLLFFFNLTDSIAQESPDVLIGKWKLDMSPQNLDDDNFAMMEITSVKNDQLKGTFYRDGVKLKNGHINTQTGRIYGALMSGDNSGSYNTSFYYEDGKLYGSTHAVDRAFLAVWVAVKE
ncbi:MAG: hypothetical protein HRT61_05655 [Ekhidna sp.]|nr:hypothetical protein [Ekhidna sp.]